MTPLNRLNRPTRASRRDFLKSAGALGAAAGLPPLLFSACGGDDDDKPAVERGKREAHDLHFDLSLAPIAEPRLFALRSDHHGQRLTAHDSASRQRFRSANPLLESIPDEQLTHYFEAADLPAGALQGVLVTGKHPTTGKALLAAAHIHVPESARASVAQRARQKGVARFSGKRDAYRVPQPSATDPLPDGLTDLSTPWDIAVYLVFHTPEVMNLNPDLGAEIVSRIEHLPCDPNAGSSCNPVLGTLASAIGLIIYQKGHPSETPGSWCTLVPTTDTAGNLQKDADGNQIYRYDLNDNIAATASAVAKEILKDVFNDPMFAGTNWHATSAATAVEASPPTPTPIAAAVSSGFAVAASSPPGTSLSGIRFVDLQVADEALRSVKLTIKNDYLRFLSIFVQFADSSGTVLAVDSPGALDTTRSKLLQMVGSNDQIMGIPFQGSTVQSTDVVFTVPDAASSATLIFGSLGLGGEAFSPEAVIGSSLTLALNVGIPTILLAAGAYVDISAALKDGVGSLFKDGKLLAVLAGSLLSGLKSSGSDIAGGIFGSATAESCQSFLVTLANVAVQALLDSAPTLLAWLGAAILSTSLIAAALGPLGIAIKILAALASLAEIAVTLGESLSCPALTRNTISLTMDSVITLSRDPRDFQFPAAARSIQVDAYYDGGTTPRTQKASIVQGQVDPVDVTLSGVPSGGQVKFVARLFSADGCLVGWARTDSMKNDEATAGKVCLQITEVLAALKADTVYEHSLKLGYANGARTWLTDALPPQLTQANLCNGGDDAICQLGSLTVNTPTGMVGYSYSAGSQGVPICDGGSTSGSLYTAQNLFLGSGPDTALKFVTCGYADPVGLVYDTVGDANGHNFTVFPSGKQFVLTSVTLDKTTAFDQTTDSVWGYFSLAMDSVTTLSNGYVIGVNRQLHKMQVLRLPAAPGSLTDATKAAPFAATKSGQGSRIGLVDTPVAVSSVGATVYVLEQGNARVQAFTADADAANVFTDPTDSTKTTSVLDLSVQAGKGATFLDLTVEGQGYLYVLYYVNSGSLPTNYRLDVYTPKGEFLCRTTSVSAARIAVDAFRNLYTLNYDTLVGSPRVEPTLSQWLPKTPSECPTTLPSGGATGSAGGSPLSFGRVRPSDSKITCPAT